LKRVSEGTLLFALICIGVALKFLTDLIRYEERPPVRVEIVLPDSTAESDSLETNENTEYMVD